LNTSKDEENHKTALQYLHIQAILITGLLITFTFTINLDGLFSIILGSSIAICIIICCYASYYSQQIIFGKLTELKNEEAEKFRNSIRKHLNLPYYFIGFSAGVSLIGIVMLKISEMNT